MKNFSNKKINILSAVLLIFFIILFSFGDLLVTKKASAAWYSSGGTWGYRKQITVDPERVSGSSNLTDFPMLFKVTDSDLKHTDHGGKMGKIDATDMLFTSSDGSTKLSHEIEYYASTTGEMVAWVKVPTLYTAQQTLIYVYFGNSGASDQQDVTNVWDSSYTGVWHMKENTTTLADSTTNAYSLTKTAATQPYRTTAKIGYGQGIEFFDGATTNSAVNTSNTSLITWEGWVMSTSTLTSNSSLFETYAGSGNYPLTVRTGSGSVRGTVFGPSFTTISSATINDGNWHHVAFVHDSTLFSVYTDGVLTTSSVISSGSYANSNGYIKLEYHESLIVDPDMFVDEFRFSNNARSEDWIKTSYNNQNSPTSFYAYGAVGVENRSAAGVSTKGVAPTSGSSVKVRGGVKFR